MSILRRSLFTSAILFVASASVAAAQHRAWLGVALGCTRCSWKTSGTKELWQFSQFPVIEAVDPAGPAARAGMRSGDVIRQIDGVPLTSEEGARRLVDAKPGQKLSITYDRNGMSRRASVIAGDRPTPERVGALAPESHRGDTAARVTRVDESLRFSGTFGEMEVKVHGPPDVRVVEEQGKCGALILTPTHRVELTCRRQTSSRSR